MVDNHSPDDSFTVPVRPGAAQFATAEGLWFRIALFPILAICGASLGFVTCVVASLVLEVELEPAEPTLTYGQQWGLLVLPLCTLIGAAIGLGISFAIVQRPTISIVLLLLTSIGGAGIVASMWTAQIARYGRDPSEVVLYYPPLAFSMLALAAAVLVALAGFVRWRSLSTRLTQHRTPDQR